MNLCGITTTTRKVSRNHFKGKYCGGGDILKNVGDGEEYDQYIFYKKLTHIKHYCLLEVQQTKV